MKLRSKIIIAFSLIAIFSVCIIGIVGISIGKKTMEVEAFEKLTAIRELKANRIEAYFEQINNQLLSFSENFMVVEALEDYHKAFKKIKQSELNISEEEIDISLKSYYENEFLPKINSNSISSFNLEHFYPKDYHTKLLQYLYISNNENNIGEKHLLVDSNDKSEYSKVHSKYHPVFTSFLEKFGYYDIFLVDISGHIVYSVHKEVDYATSLRDDVFKNSNLAKAAIDALSSEDKDFTKLIDFDQYQPSFNDHASFMSSPIYKGDIKIGALVFQLPVDRINNIMTDNQQWNKAGLGGSGETYLVGSDLLLRNQSRFLIEDKEGYILTLNKIGLSDDTINQIKTFNNSIGLQKVNTIGVKNAFKGDTGISIFNDYRGVSVLSSYKPLTIKDVDWVIMSEVDEEEAFSAIETYVNSILLWVLLIIILIPLTAFYFSKSITDPLVKLTNVSKEMAGGKLEIETGMDRTDEIGILANSFDSMRDSIKRMMNELERANETLEDKVKERTKEAETANIKTQAIISNANDAIITIDEKQTILLINPAANKIFGYSNEDLVGKSLLELLPDNLRGNHQKQVDSFKEDKSSSKQMNYRPEVKGKRKNGELFFAEVSISKQKIDGNFQFTAFLKDVTERKIAEEKIQISENMFRSISASASDAIISANNKGIIEFWNDAAQKIFNYTSEEAIGQNLEIIIPEKHHEGHNRGISRVVSGGTKNIIGKVVETEGMRKGGELFPIELAISSWKGIDGLNFSSVIRDISKRKEMEAKIELANKRMEDELKVGRDIQMSMLPLIFPAFPDHTEFNIYALLESAREVGGDFYDFYFIDENKFLFTIADVSGKGVPSALFMAVCKTLIKSRSTEDDSPSSIVTHINDELSRENSSSMFVTLFLCIIDLSTGELRYTNAGHNPPYLKRVNGEIETLNTLHGPVVGALEDFAYGENNLRMQANDILLLFTDGVNEAMDIDKKLYSNEPIIDNLKSFKGETIINDVDNIFNSVKKFQGDAEQADDITILGFEYLEPIVTDIKKTASILIKNDLSEIRRLNDFFNDFCEKQEISRTVYRKFNTVLDELINNIVSYGYNDKKEHDIRIKIILTATQLVVSIEDDAIAFNPLNLATPNTEADIDDREIGGLGVHIFRNLMDNVSYKRFIKKNLTTLYKNINK